MKEVQAIQDTMIMDAAYDLTILRGLEHFKKELGWGEAIDSLHFRQRLIKRARSVFKKYGREGILQIIEHANLMVEDKMPMELMPSMPYKRKREIVRPMGHFEL